MNVPLFPFLEKVKNKFGQIAIDNINKMLEIKLKRKIIKEKYQTLYDKIYSV
jgi:hypothetical protein